MRDHVTHELISAYIDGELEGDELKLVENLLAESPEHQQLLAEFQSLRASMWSLPSFNLPTDFHSRVVSQIDQLAASPAKGPVRRFSRTAKARSWRSGLLAAASLAALVILTVMIRPPSPAPIIPGPPGRTVTPFEMPVYFQQVPNYCMVYDVTLTPAGQGNKAVDKLLENLGIGIDPALRLDGTLEQQLMVIRESQQVGGETEATPYKQDPATPKSTDKDKVEMIYVASTIGVLDQFSRDLQGMRNVGVDVSQLRYDLVIEPNKVGAMHRLHDTAREHFAHRAYIVPSDIGQAFRFRIELTSVSIPGAAAFPMPRIRTTSAERDRTTAAPDVNGDGAITAADALQLMPQLNQFGGEPDAGNAFGQGGQPANWAKEPGHILLIIRSVGANADDK